MLREIFKEVLLSGLVDGKGEEDKREPASLMKQESKDGVQYNPLDAGALVEGGKVIGQNSFKMAGQVTSKQLKNEHTKNSLKKINFYKVNRCLARYSPRATTTNQPTNRALNKPA